MLAKKIKYRVHAELTRLKGQKEDLFFTHGTRASKQESIRCALWKGAVSRFKPQLGESVKLYDYVPVYTTAEVQGLIDLDDDIDDDAEYCRPLV